MVQGAPLERPIAPHLQIWRFTTTMAASITHRLTGTALYGGTALLAIWLCALAFNAELFAAATTFIRSPIGLIIMAGFVWSLCFHLINGLRHLYWDAGRGLAPNTATATAWVTYIVSFALAAALVWFGLAAKGGA